MSWYWWLLIAIVAAELTIEVGFVYIETMRAARDAKIWAPRDMILIAYILLPPSAFGDAVFNTFRGSRVFRELPQWQHKEWLFSWRVQRWVDVGPSASWRYDTAVKWGQLLNFAARTDHIKRLPE